MIEVYRRIDGKDKLVRTFDNIIDLFQTPGIREYQLSHFGYVPCERTTDSLLFGEMDYLRFYITPNSRCRYIAYENDILITPDRLVGEYRAWTSTWTYRRFFWTQSPPTFPYKFYRRPKTTQERRWANAWDGEEFPPRVRMARNKRNLPSAWDDIPLSINRHNNKSWKSHSKRRHQWKPK